MDLHTCAHTLTQVCTHAHTCTPPPHTHTLTHTGEYNCTHSHTERSAQKDTFICVYTIPFSLKHTYSSSSISHTFTYVQE